MTHEATKSKKPASRGIPPGAPRKSKPAMPSSLDVSLGYLLRRAQIFAFQQFGEFMDEFDLRPSQYAAIVLIGSNPGLTQSAVSDALGIQRANFVAMIDLLEGRGVLERRKVGGDRRSFALHLTAKGERLLRKIEKAHAACERHMADRLGEKRSGQFLALLQEFTGGHADPYKSS